MYLNALGTLDERNFEFERPIGLALPSLRKGAILLGTEMGWRRGEFEDQCGVVVFNLSTSCMFIGLLFNFRNVFSW